MNLDELKAERYRTKNDLEGILGKFRLSESEVYFVHSKDIGFIKKLLQLVDSYYLDFITEVNTDRITEDDIIPHRISDNDKKILDRIVEHAEQYRDSGIVKYRIQDQYMTPQEVKETIKKYLDSKFISSPDFKFLSYKLYYLDKHHLSAKQTVIIENIFDKADERTKKAEAGIIFFNPAGDSKIYEMGNRLINCALDRGRIPNQVSTEDILEVKDKYLCRGEAGLGELRERLRMEMKGKTGCRTFSKYEPVIKLLEKYITIINPDLYVINGLRCAVPVHLV